MDASSWSSTCPIIRLYTQEELNRAKTADVTSPGSGEDDSEEDFGSSASGSGSLVHFASPVLKLKSDARRYFDGFALPIVNEKWKERWSLMCAMQSGLAGAGGGAGDAGEDGGRNGDVEMDVFGGRGEREEERKRKEKELEERAERWRAAPHFLREECNMVTLGGLFPLATINQLTHLRRSDEAESVIGLASDWLELDSPDDWIRHDCEIALKSELSYALYLGLTSIILPFPNPINPLSSSTHAASYGRAIRACLESSPFCHVAVRLALYDPALLSTAQKRNPAGMPIPPASPGFPPPPPSPAFSVCSVSGGSPATFASAQLSALASGSSLSLSSMSVNTSPSPNATRSSSLNLNAPPVGELSGTWEAWDAIRTICGYNSRLTLGAYGSP